MADHPLSTFRQIDPVFGEHLKATDALVYGEGALSRKHKLLIALAFDAANGAERGVTSLARSAMKEGATAAEIAEAVRVAAHLSGVGAVYTASAGLKEIFS
jgi:alkylhydroperoxidase/carboxymuconolactone decarboxylase family protein YurZ